MPDPDHPDYRAPDIWHRLVETYRRHPVSVGTHYGDVVCEPGWTWQTRICDHDLWSVVRGRGRAEVNDRTVELSAGVTLALRPGDRVRAQQDPRDRLRVCFVHHEFADAGSPVPTSTLLPRVLRLTDRGGVQDRMRAIVHWVHREGQPGRARAAVELQTVLLDCHRQVAQGLGALPPPMDPRVAQVVDLLRSRPGDRFSLAEAATVARLSPGVFSRLFTAQTGQTFRSYGVRVRMERARDLLATSTLSVAEVALALGYRDHRLFVRQFTDATGRTPGSWRTGTTSDPLPD